MSADICVFCFVLSHCAVCLISWYHIKSNGQIILFFIEVFGLTANLVIQPEFKQSKAMNE